MAKKPSWNLITGDSRRELKKLPAGSIRCCVTSPPYWGLRDYGTASWKGGKDPSCDHIERTAEDLAKSSTLGHPTTNAFYQSLVRQYKDICKKCGAKRVDLQMGLEDSPAQYIEQMVKVFREVRRVLTDDGTLWLNIGDSYTAGGNNRNGIAPSEKWGKRFGGKSKALNAKSLNENASTGLKPKDLVGIPWSLAFALREDGWYLRSDIIWAKKNPMPESVTDRPTKSHEYLFLMSKSQTYHYDAEAISDIAINAGRIVKASKAGAKNHEIGDDVNDRATAKGLTFKDTLVKETRNARTVWHIGSKPYKGAHFAVMPKEMIRKCILAGSKPGDMVLDPFFGSGTVGAVAIPLGRSFTGIDLNPKYKELAEKRIRRAPWENQKVNKTYRSTDRTFLEEVFELMDKK